MNFTILIFNSKDVFVTDLGIAVNNLNPWDRGGRQAELPPHVLPSPQPGQGGGAWEGGAGLWSGELCKV